MNADAAGARADEGFGPLRGVRVLDLAGERGHFCGKALAELGAQVTKVEPPGGLETRRAGPFLGDEPDPNNSLYFWHFNAGKRGVTLDLEAPEGQSLLKRLVRPADVLLESFPPGHLDRLGVGYNALAEENPGLILASVTPFGQDGPYRDFKSSDLVNSALGGLAFVCGYDDLDGSPPVNPDGEPTYHLASQYATMAILAALWSRQSTGRGAHVDVSIHEAVNCSTEWSMPTYFFLGKNVRRQTGRHATHEPTQPWQFKAKDGRDVNLLGVLPRDAKSWTKLLAWMEERGAAGDLNNPEYSEFVTGRLKGGSWRNVDKTTEGRHIIETIIAFVKTLDSQEVYHGGQQRGLPWSVIYAPDETLDEQHLKDRGFFREVSYPELGRRFTHPGLPYRFSESPGGIAWRAPLVGEHNREVYCDELGLSEEELHSLADRGVI